MSNYILMVVQFILIVVLAPIVWAASLAFYKHLEFYPALYRDAFLSGLVTFLFSFLFFNRFEAMFRLGQDLMGKVFKFIAPFDRIITSIISLYVLVLMIVFFCVTTFLGAHQFDAYFMFFIGFLSLMHVLLLAQGLQDEEKSFIKLSCLLTMCFVVIFDIFLILLFLDLISADFTFLDFLGSLCHEAADIYKMIFSRVMG